MDAVRSFERWAARRANLGLLLLRLVTGGHLLYMTRDNVASWPRMLEFRDFLALHGFALPLACAVASVAAQFVGGALLALGLYTRVAGLAVAVNFAVAVWMIDSRQPYPAAFAGLSLVAAALCLMFTGPGRWSLDRLWRKQG